VVTVEIVRMMNMLRLGSIVVVVSALAGCTERVNLCHSDSECTNPAFPFCDVNGEYDESGHVANSCSIEPANCPVERCGCSPGTVSCEADQLVTCNGDGKDVTKETCALGCAPEGDRCQIFDPSNGLTNQLLASANSAAVALPDGTTIDTTTGVVKVNGTPMSVVNVSVPQATGPAIRVMLARSWAVGNVRVTGTMPLALVSVGTITLNGLLDASANTTEGLSGPGSVSSAAVCVGGNSMGGGGGGGNATSGGNSESVVSPVGVPGGALGGQPQATIPFTGGCIGGSKLSGDPATSQNNGGWGGGAIQLASLSRIEVTTTATVSLGGGGGRDPQGGGGSGGNLIVEAPTVRVSGKVYANGGGGAACGTRAPDANLSLVPAAGPSCSGGGGASGGSGGTGSAPPTNGSGGQFANPAGGGGAVGRVYIATRDGVADMTGSTVSAATAITMLNPR
jgi:hypothetical protein